MQPFFILMFYPRPITESLLLNDQAFFYSGNRQSTQRYLLLGLCSSALCVIVGEHEVSEDRRLSYVLFDPKYNLVPSVLCYLAGPVSLCQGIMLSGRKSSRILSPFLAPLQRHCQLEYKILQHCTSKCS